MARASPLIFEKKELIHVNSLMGQGQFELSSTRKKKKKKNSAQPASESEGPELPVHPGAEFSAAAHAVTRPPTPPRPVPEPASGPARPPARRVNGLTAPAA